MYVTSEARVSVVICTYKRATGLTRCLSGLARQRSIAGFEIVVVDNDADASAAEIARVHGERLGARGVRVVYLVEAEQGIAYARNRAVAAASGDYVAFLDDDEVPSATWLADLVRVAESTNADGVFAGVAPVFTAEFPKWIRFSGLFDRYSGHECARMSPRGFATSNVLVKAPLLRGRPGPFDANLAHIGGEDSELFDYLAERCGAVFVWTRTALVFEWQERSRVSLGWHCRRWYRSGWVHTYKRLRFDGTARGVVRIAISCVGGLVQTLIMSVARLPRGRAAFVYLLRGLAAQAGKLGYFAGIRVEEYKRR